MEDFTKGNKNNFSESKYQRKYDAALSNLKGRLSAEDLSVRVSASLTANSHMSHLIFSVIRQSFWSTGKARFSSKSGSLVTSISNRPVHHLFFILPIFLFGKSDKLRRITRAFLPENLKVGEQKQSKYPFTAVELLVSLSQSQRASCLLNRQRKQRHCDDINEDAQI